MRIGKRIISLVLALVVVCSLTGSLLVPASAATLPFTDISNSDYRDAIEYVYINGIMQGVTSTTFAPQTPVTRAMMVTILYRISGSEEKRAPTEFTDVEAGRYYYYAVGWAQENGIVNGITSTTFEPDTEVTREQALTFLMRYAKQIGGMSYSIPNANRGASLDDDSLISKFAKEAVNWALNCGIVDGGVNALGGKQSTTRELCAEYLYKFLTLAFGGAKTLFSDEYESTSIMNDMYNAMKCLPSDVHLQSDLYPLPVEFALMNSYAVYIRCDGREDSGGIETCSNRYLYDYELENDDLSDLKLAYISASYAGGDFCAALYNSGAQNVIGFTGPVTYDLAGERLITIFDTEFFESLPSFYYDYEICMYRTQETILASCNELFGAEDVVYY